MSGSILDYPANYVRDHFGSYGAARGLLANTHIFLARSTIPEKNSLSYRSLWAKKRSWDIPDFHKNSFWSGRKFNYAKAEKQLTAQIQTFKNLKSLPTAKITTLADAPDKLGGWKLISEKIRKRQSGIQWIRRAEVLENNLAPAIIILQKKFPTLTHQAATRHMAKFTLGSTAALTLADIAIAAHEDGKKKNKLFAFDDKAYEAIGANIGMLVLSTALVGMTTAGSRSLIFRTPKLNLFSMFNRTVLFGASLGNLGYKFGGEMALRALK